MVYGNRRRLVKIELVSDELGADPLANGATLVALDYNPAGKGNNFVISYGDEAAPASHVVAGPVALWQAQDRDGLVVSLEIEPEVGLTHQRGIRFIGAWRRVNPTAFRNGSTKEKKRGKAERLSGRFPGIAGASPTLVDSSIE